MGLVDLFRPKWKHSDDAVREAAVRQLTEDDLDALRNVVRHEASEAIRTIAVKKINDPELLAEIASSDASDALRTIAEKRVNSFWASIAISSDDEDQAQRALERIGDQRGIAEVARAATKDAVRQSALVRLTDPKSLAELVRTATDQTTSLNALQRINDPTVLKSIAIDEERKDVAIAAVKKLDDPDALQTIAKAGKNKAARTHAKRLLDEKSASEKPALSEKKKPPALPDGKKRSKAQLVQLCESMESMSKRESRDWSDVLHTIETTQTEWSKLQGDADELNARFLKACEHLYARHDVWKQKQEAVKEREHELLERIEARRKLCERVEAIQGSSSTDIAAVESLENAWENLVGIPESHDRGLTLRFKQACAQVRERVAQIEQKHHLDAKLLKLCEEADALLFVAEPKHALARLNKLETSWKKIIGEHRANPDAVLKARFEKVQHELQQRKQALEVEELRHREEHTRTLEALFAEMDALKLTDDVRHAERMLRQARAQFQAVIDELPRDLAVTYRDRFAELRDALAVRVRELKVSDEWKRWANVPLKEKLCEQVESLLQREDADLGAVAKELKQLQAEWKRMGSVSVEKSEELWTRFKTASDAVYTKCQAYFTKMDEVRVANLARKEALCDEVEALVESTDAETASMEIKKRQEEWKTIGPVPKEQAQAVWKRFRTACDRFFSQQKAVYEERDREREAHRVKKEALCVEVEALKDSTEWGQTTESMKSFQASWKTIGSAGPKEDRLLWKRFRAACDHFFDRRNHRFEVEKQERIQQKQAILASIKELFHRQEAESWEAESSTEPMDANAIANKILEQYRVWLTIGAIPREMRLTLSSQLNETCGAFIEQHPELFRGSELGLDTMYQTKRVLCDDFESLVSEMTSDEAFPMEEPPSAATQPDDVASRLKEALVANTFRENVTPKRARSRNAIEREFQELELAWIESGPVVGNELKQLEERMKHTVVLLKEKGFGNPVAEVAPAAAMPELTSLESGSAESSSEKFISSESIPVEERVEEVIASVSTDTVADSPQVQEDSSPELFTSDADEFPDLDALTGLNEKTLA